MALIRYPVRVLGLLLLAGAFVLLIEDIVLMDWPRFSGFSPDPLGALLHSAIPQALNLAQALIQRYVSPFLWDPIIQTVLTWWDWAVFGAIGGLLAYLARRPSDKPDPAAVETAG